MRIKKWIDVNQEIEVDVNSDDINQIFIEDPDSMTAVLNAINNAAAIIVGVPDKMIYEMQRESRDVIGSFLETQAKRYKGVVC